MPTCEAVGCACMCDKVRCASVPSRKPHTSTLSPYGSEGTEWAFCVHFPFSPFYRVTLMVYALITIMSCSFICVSVHCTHNGSQRKINKKRKMVNDRGFFPFLMYFNDHYTHCYCNPRSIKHCTAAPCCAAPYHVQ